MTKSNLDGEPSGATQGLTAVVLIGSWVLSLATGVSMAMGAWGNWSDSNVVVRVVLALVAFSLGTTFFRWAMGLAGAAFVTALERIKEDEGGPLGAGIFAWTVSGAIWLVTGVLCVGVTTMLIIGGKTGPLLIVLGIAETGCFLLALGFIPLMCSAAIAGTRRGNFWFALLCALTVYVLAGALGQVFEPDGTFADLPWAIAKRVLFSALVFGLLSWFASWRFRRERSAKLRPTIDGLRAKKELRGELTSADAATLERLTAEYLRQFPSPPAA